MKLLHNPFTVIGTIQQCWLFVYRLPEKVARPLLPRPLELVTHGGFAFLNIVVCQLSGMRPVPLPEPIGLGYWHVAYRLHAAVESADGQRREGLYFLRSDCDHWAVEKVGNLVTDFHFHRADVRVTAGERGVEGLIRSTDAPARFTISLDAPAREVGSPFLSLEEAATFLKYKPMAFSVVDDETVQVLRVRREESDWHSRLATVADAHWSFLAGLEAALEVCYVVEPITYRWERGQNVRVQPCV